MAFRIEARIGSSLMLAVALLGSGEQAFTVRHRHLRGGTAGELRVTAEGLAFAEQGKGAKHSRDWKFEEIQQLELSADTLRVLTYEDQKWKLGLDREYVFDRLPEGFAHSVYAQWRDRLDQRFIADLPDGDMKPLWVVPAKLLGAIRGSQGTLRVGTDRVVYETGSAGQSRTWRFTDIDNVASGGPFDLSIVTRENHGVWNSGTREFRFQLKQPLPESRFNELWRRLNSARQLDLVRTSIQEAGATH